MKNRRHQGKHTRPYACKEACCNVKPFGDKAGLIRHSREVHGAQAEGGFTSLRRENIDFGSRTRGLATEPVNLSLAIYKLTGTMVRRDRESWRAWSFI